MTTMKPTLEQEREWLRKAAGGFSMSTHGIGIVSAATRLAYAEGADDELAACCDWIDEQPDDFVIDGELLRYTRRPQSLKRRALKAVDCIESDFNTVGDRCDTIRRALNLLPGD